MCAHRPSGRYKQSSGLIGEADFFLYRTYRTRRRTHAAAHWPAHSVVEASCQDPAWRLQDPEGLTCQQFRSTPNFLQNFCAQARPRQGMVQTVLATSPMISSNARVTAPGSASHAPLADRVHLPLNLPRPYIGAPAGPASPAGSGDAGERQMQPRFRARSRLTRQNRVAVSSCDTLACPQASHARPMVSPPTGSDPDDRS
jgi:hypothetical protein